MQESRVDNAWNFKRWLVMRGLPIHEVKANTPRHTRIIKANKEYLQSDRILMDRQRRNRRHFTETKHTTETSESNSQSQTPRAFLQKSLQDHLSNLLAGIDATLKRVDYGSIESSVKLANLLRQKLCIIQSLDKVKAGFVDQIDTCQVRAVEMSFESKQSITQIISESAESWVGMDSTMASSTLQSSVQQIQTERAIFEDRKRNRFEKVTVQGRSRSGYTTGRRKFVKFL